MITSRSGSFIIIGAGDFVKHYFFQDLLLIKVTSFLQEMVRRFCSHGLPLKGMVILLGIIIFGFGIGECNLIPGEKILEVRKGIKHLKSHTVRSIQIEDGDIIDCIDIYKQPAFDHPALRNHTIQMAPSYDPNIEETTTKTNRLNNQDSSMSLASQLWQKSGSCPKGTIPVRRLPKKVSLKTISLEDYGRKKPSSSPPLTHINKDISSNLQQSNRSVAILLTEGYSYSGVKGDIKVWNPHVESDDEYSTSQVSLKSGPYYDFESVEAGWAVNPSVYGDRKTRLFVYWTADASKKTGCFDLTCPGFVQTSSEIALGAAIYPLSVPSGLPYQITLFIFKSEDGDLIDCVDIYKQPAFDHPALKNHTIQMQPSFIPSIETPNEEHENSRPTVSQLWKKRDSCPKGTVPIRRIRRRELLRTNGRKSPEHFQTINKTGNQDRFGYLNTTNGPILSPTPENRSTAILLTYGYNYIGASGEINVWNPHVEKLPEFTTAQIWLKSGEVDDFESVEAGWTVHPAQYGDTLTRFFAYWTVDGYKKTGCFDLTCSGFVQTSTEVALGGALDPGSSTYQQQVILPINIFMDPNTANWWLVFANITVGYWPGSLFYYLRHSATSVEWGGQVYSSNVKKTPHTKTAMGSGYEAEALFGFACFIRYPRIMDYSKSYKYPTFVGIWKDEYNCYSAVNYKAGNANDEAVFFFGGPGQSYSCP